MSSVLITGASRGFGLALARELVSLPASRIGKVFATARGDSAALNELAQKFPDRVILVHLDVANQDSIKKAAAQVESKLGGKGLDILINNAGVCQYAPGGVPTMDNLEDSFAINVLGVHWTTREFLPLLKKGTLKKVANISTTLGSIALAGAGAALPAPAYKISKAAMNALTVQYALEYEKEGFSFIALCPGWMKTDLGGGDMAAVGTSSLAQLLERASEINARPEEATHVVGIAAQTRGMGGIAAAGCTTTPTIATVGPTASTLASSEGASWVPSNLADLGSVSDSTLIPGSIAAGDIAAWSSFDTWNTYLQDTTMDLWPTHGTDVA